MADCPYGKRAENALGPMLQKMGDQIDLKVYFIADEVGVDDVSVPSAASRGAPGCSGTATGTGRFRSLHGDAEVEEGIRQLVIQKLYPDKMWDYILTRNAETSAWRDCALKLGMDVVEIEKMAAGETGASLFSDNIRRANLLGIHASPTLRVNGQEVEAFFDPTALALAICKADSGVVLCADMPVCRHDADCAASGKIGICVDANTPQAKCEEYPTVSFGVQVLNDSTCSVCETYPFVRSTLALFPGAKFETVEVHSDAGRLLKNRYGLDRVPSFVLDADFARAARFDRFQHTVVRVGDAFVPDVRMTAVARILTENEARGIDTFIDLAHPAAVGLAERLVGWVQDVKQMDRLRLHFVGEAEGDRLFRQAFLLDARRAYDALLVYARHQRQRRPDFLVAMCLEKVGFSLAGLRAAKDGARTQHIDTMHALGGQRDMVPFVVLDSQVVVSGVGLARLEAVFYQMHPELAEKDRNVRRP
jgi:hypothetical protein